MSLHIKTMACNGWCRSCYEEKIRAVMPEEVYNIEAMEKSLEERFRASSWKPSICIHGGEPLLLKDEDLERLFKKAYELKGCANIQTNLISLSDFHISLFKKYKVSIGVSIDGDTAELNRGRWNAERKGRKLTDEEIQKATDGVLRNMKRLKEAGLGLSVILLLRKYNASADKIEDLIRCLKRFRDEFGVSSFRTNEAIVFEPEWRKEEELTGEELGKVYCRIADEVLSDPKCDWLPCRDIIDLLLGYKDSTCVFGTCDVWKSGSETTIMADGSIGVCLKNGGAIDGMQILEAETKGLERYDLLKQVPQDELGCKDCKWWFICMGGCPGAGVDNDWRNRTRFCEGWKMLYEYLSYKIKCLLPNARTVDEYYPARPDVSELLSSLTPGGSSWKRNKQKNKAVMPVAIKKICESDGHGDSHGDKAHADRAHGDSGGAGYQDGQHGDVSHGDSHGDSSHGDSGYQDIVYKEISATNRDHGDAPHGDHLDAGGR